MEKNILKFLCKLEGFNTAIRSLHWNSKNLSQHKLCDDIADRLADFQDQVGEIEQSISGNLPFNKLKPIEYNIKDLKKFVEDVINDTNEFYKKVKKMGEKYVGMSSDCESFLSDMQRNLYLVNFTIKEDFKRNYRNKKRMDENANISTKIKISESELCNVINEAIHNILEKKPFKDIKGVVNANIKGLSESCDEAEVKGGEYENKELNFTHFAVNKTTNLIVDGWDYSGYDTEDLSSDKNGYFYDDLKNNGFNPKAYKILSFKACKRIGLNPNDKSNWSNTGVFSLSSEQKMKQDGDDFYALAYKNHPDWFIE